MYQHTTIIVVSIKHIFEKETILPILFYISNDLIYFFHIYRIIIIIIKLRSINFISFKVHLNELMNSLNQIPT